MSLPVDKSGSEGVVDRTLASSPRGTRGSTQEGNTGKQSTGKHLLLRSKHEQASTRSNTRHRTYRRERLLTISVEYSSHTTIPHVYGGSSCLATGDQQSC